MCLCENSVVLQAATGSASGSLSAPGLHLIHAHSVPRLLYEGSFIQHTHTHTHGLEYGNNYEKEEDGASKCSGLMAPAHVLYTV